MEFRFKLAYRPKGGKSLAALLGRHVQAIKIEESYEDGSFQIAVCVCKSLADGLRISRELGAELEILHCEDREG